MFSWTKQVSAAAVIGLATLTVAVPQASGQFQARPGLTAQQYAYNLATLGQALASSPANALGSPYGQLANIQAANPYASLYSSPSAALTSNPYDSYGGYSPYAYYQDPAGAYLQGAASVINAQGRLMVNQMQAFSLKEQVRAERIANRRRIFDEYLYEREKTPTAEEERQRFLNEQLQHSRNNPSVTEIWSGKALNDILADLRKGVGKVESGHSFQVPLDEDGLKRINVTSSKSGNNVGLLKNEGRLNWPAALSGPDFKMERERVATLAQKAVQQAEFNNQVDPGVIQQMTRDVDAIQKQLRRNGGDLPPSLYMEAKTFLNNLDDGVRALQQRDVGNYFNGKYTLKGKTVPDVVKYMVDQGLQFAPAVPGDEAAYAALHQALAAYDLASHSTVERQP
jgi:hypothetical protein